MDPMVPDRDIATRAPDEAVEAVVLSGGGALGAFEIGVIEALVSGRWARGRGPVVPRVFAGTSVGAYNAAFLVSRAEDIRQAVGDLCRVWLKCIASLPGRPSHVFRTTRAVRAALPFLYSLDLLIGLLRETPFTHAPRLRQMVRHLLRTVPGEILTNLAKPVRYVDSRPLDSLIRRTIQVDRLLAPDAPPLLVPAMNWHDGRVDVFHNRPDLEGEFRVLRVLRTRAMTASTVLPILRASAAIPGIVEPVEVDGHPFADGSELMAGPVQATVDYGARVIHSIGTTPPVNAIGVDAVPSVLQAFERVLVAGPTDEFLETMTITEILDDLGAAAQEWLDSWPESPIPRRPGGERLLGVTRALADRAGVTVHKHFPPRLLGGRMLGVLDFDRSHLVDLMRQGFEAAVEHDCVRNGCLLPDQDSLPSTRSDDWSWLHPPPVAAEPAAFS